MAYCGWGTETRRHRASRQHARRPPSHRQRAPPDSVERLLGRPGKSAVKANSSSVACWWSEVRYVCVNNLPVAVTLLEHQRNSDGRQRAELLRDIRRSSRWHNCGCVAEEACDSHGPVAIELDEPIAILRERLNARKSLLELIEYSLLDPHVRRLVCAAPHALRDPNPIGAHQLCLCIHIHGVLKRPVPVDEPVDRIDVPLPLSRCQSGHEHAQSDRERQEASHVWSPEMGCESACGAGSA